MARLQQTQQSKAFYTKGQFLEFCQDVFGYYKSTSGGTNIQVVCPNCKILKGKSYSKRKLAILIDSPNKFHCWVCGYGSKSLIHLLKKYFPTHLQVYLDNFLDAEELNKYTLEQQEHEQLGIKRPTSNILALPDDFLLLAASSPKTDSSAREAINYLKARGAGSEATLWYWRLGISKGDRRLYRRVIVPSLDKNGVLNYYSARSIKDNAPRQQKYVNPEVERENVIFNEINLDFGEELVLVEGVFDLIKSNENTTCLLGSDLRGHFKLFQEIVKNKTPVVLALDPEAIYQTHIIAKRLFEFGIKVRLLKLRPGQEDIGSLTSKTEFNELLEAAIVYNSDYLLRTRINNIV